MNHPQPSAGGPTPPANPHAMNRPSAVRFRQAATLAALTLWAALYLAAALWALFAR